MLGRFGNRFTRKFRPGFSPKTAGLLFNGFPRRYASQYGSKGEPSLPTANILRKYSFKGSSNAESIYALTNGNSLLCISNGHLGGVLVRGDEHSEHLILPNPYLEYLAKKHWAALPVNGTASLRLGPSTQDAELASVIQKGFLSVGKGNYLIDGIKLLYINGQKVIIGMDHKLYSLSHDFNCKGTTPIDWSSGKNGKTIQGNMDALEKEINARYGNTDLSDAHILLEKSIEFIQFRNITDDSIYKVESVLGNDIVLNKTETVTRFVDISIGKKVKDLPNEDEIILPGGVGKFKMINNAVKLILNNSYICNDIFVRAITRQFVLSKKPTIPEENELKRRLGTNKLVNIQKVSYNINEEPVYLLSISSINEANIEPILYDGLNIYKNATAAAGINTPNSTSPLEMKGGYKRHRKTRRRKLRHARV